MANADGQLVRLNVGGTLYTTTRKTLISREPGSFFGQFFASKETSAGKLAESSDTNQTEAALDRENRQPEVDPSQSALDQPELAKSHETNAQTLSGVSGHDAHPDNLLATRRESSKTRALAAGSQQHLQCPPSQQLLAEDLAFVLSDGTVFIDRDGQMFAHVLGYLRTGKLLVGEHFQRVASLREEARFYQLQGLTKLLTEYSAAADKSRTTALLTAAAPLTPPLTNRRATLASASALRAETGGYITLGYRGTFAFGRDGQADVKFRKLHRILVCGKVSLCREVFGDTLNESRDPDREGHERYTSRLYLKHQCLEKACDTMAEKGFKLVATCCSGANGLTTAAAHAIFSGGGQSSSNTQQLSAMVFPRSPRRAHSRSLTNLMMKNNPSELINQRNSGDFEEQRWAHYTEYVFYREAGSNPLLFPAATAAALSTNSTPEHYLHPSSHHTSSLYHHSHHQPQQQPQHHQHTITKHAASFLNLATT